MLVHKIVAIWQWEGNAGQPAVRKRDQTGGLLGQRWTAPPRPAPPCPTPLRPAPLRTALLDSTAGSGAAELDRNARIQQKLTRRVENLGHVCVVCQRTHTYFRVTAPMRAAIIGYYRTLRHPGGDAGRYATCLTPGSSGSARRSLRVSHVELGRCRH